MYEQTERQTKISKKYIQIYPCLGMIQGFQKFFARTGRAVLTKMKRTYKERERLPVRKDMRETPGTGHRYP